MEGIHVSTMKTLFAIILIPSLLLADGVVLFEKSTGIMQERYVQQVVTNQEDGVICTNNICAFQKLQPIATTYDGNRILGAQVLKKVDWAVYDLASFSNATENPIRTNDLTDVTPFDVLTSYNADAEEVQSKATIQTIAESNLLAVCASVGYTNRPIDWIELDAIGNQMYATATTTEQKIDALHLQMTVQKLSYFYQQNGGDLRQVGKKKGKK